MQDERRLLRCAASSFPILSVIHTVFNYAALFRSCSIIARKLLGSCSGLQPGLLGRCSIAAWGSCSRELLGRGARVALENCLEGDTGLRRSYSGELLGGLGGVPLELLGGVARELNQSCSGAGQGLLGSCSGELLGGAARELLGGVAREVS